MADELLKFNAGDALFQQHDPVDSAFILKEGSLEVHCQPEEGAKPVLVRKIAKPGALVLEAVGDLSRRASTLVARDVSVAVKVGVDRSGIAGKVQQHPDFGLNLARALAEATRELGEYFGVESARVGKLAEPIDQAARTYHRLFDIFYKNLQGVSKKLTESFKELEGSSVLEHARRIPDEDGPKTTVRRRKVPMLDTEELERAGFKAEGDRFRNLPRGMTVCEAGEVAHDFYFLFRGKMEAEVDGVKVGVVNAGEFAGEVAVLLGLPVRTATLVTTEECRIMFIEREGFEPLVRGQPPLLAQLLRSLSRRLESLTSDLAQVRYQTEGLRKFLKGEKPEFFTAIDALIEAVQGAAKTHQHQVANVSRQMQELQKLRATLLTFAQGI